MISENDTVIKRLLDLILKVFDLEGSQPTTGISVGGGGAGVDSAWGVYLTEENGQRSAMKR